MNELNPEAALLLGYSDGDDDDDDELVPVVLVHSAPLKQSSRHCSVSYRCFFAPSTTALAAPGS